MSKAADSNIPKSSRIKAGQRFGRLIAITFLHNDKWRKPRWRFRCDCGVVIERSAKDVWDGHISSCGCLRREMVADKNRANAVHGQWRSAEFNVWCGMVKRCYSNRNKDYANYGGRGIKVCEQWRTNFQNFIDDMGPRPSPKHTIERKNTNGDYSPDNCIWATHREQQRNRRNNRLVIYHGREMTVAEACELAKVDHKYVRRRLDLGWDIERAIEYAREKG